MDIHCMDKNLKNVTL